MRSRPLRIALVAPEYPGCGPSYGIGAYIATLGVALANAGVDVVTLVCTPDGCFAVAPGGVPRLRREAWGLATIRAATTARWLTRELAAYESDLVEYSNWGGLGACLLGPRPRVVRLSTPIKAMRAASAMRRVTQPVHHAWETLSVLRAQRVIADSAAMADLGERTYGRTADDIIPHAYSGTIEPPRTSGEEVLAAGRLEHRKGTDVLLAAWQLVRASRPHALLHLVGADQHGFGAAALARYGSNRVVVHGRIGDAELARLRQRCRIQAIPSRFESFGMVALEAWAAGMAVVASDAGALSELVGGAGILVPAEDPVPLADALLALLGDGAACAALAGTGAERLRTRYGPAQLAASTLAVYREALRGQLPPPGLSGRLHAVSAP